MNPQSTSFGEAPQFHLTFLSTPSAFNQLCVHVTLSTSHEPNGMKWRTSLPNASPRAAFRAGAAAVINADAAALRFVACTAALVASDFLFDGGFSDVAVD